MCIVYASPMPVSPSRQAQAVNCHGVTTVPFLLPSPIRNQTFAAEYMPRRPRPASREKPGKENFVANAASSSKDQLPLPTSKRKLQAVESEPELGEVEWGDDEIPSSDENEEGDSDDGSSPDPDGDEGESDVDVDAPRVAQWVDEDDLEEPEILPRDASHGKAVNAEDIVRVVYVYPKFGWFIVCFALYRIPYKIVSWLTTPVEDYPSSHPPTDLASLPLGALRRAQRALARAQAEENPSDSEEEEGSEPESEPEEVLANNKGSKPNAHKPEWSNKPRTDIAKRANKNA